MDFSQMLNFNNMFEVINNKLLQGTGKTSADVMGTNANNSVGPVATDQTWTPPTVQNTSTSQKTNQVPAEIQLVNQSMDNQPIALPEQQSTISPAQALGLSDNKDEKKDEKAEDESTSPTWFNVVDNMTSDYETQVNGKTNKAYEDYYASQGYDSNQDQDTWWERGINALKDLFGGAGAAEAGATTGDDELYSSGNEGLAKGASEAKGTLDRYYDTAVDDGTMNAQNLTSNWVTGAQLKKQIDAGLSSLDGFAYDDIDDNALYSKRDLQLENGYTPYMPDDLSGVKMSAQQVMGKPAEAASAVRSARNDAALENYVINIDGHTIKAEDFDRDAAAKWLEENPETETYTHKESGLTFDPYVVTFGQPTYTGNGEEISQPLSDGRVLTFDTVAEYDDFWDSLMAFNSGAESDAWQKDYVNNGAEYEAKNGDKFSYDDVKKLVADTSNGEFNDDDVSYDYGWANIFKPQEAMGNNSFVEQWTPFAGDGLPMFLDALASSAPFFNPYTAAAVSTSNAYADLHKADPWAVRKDNGGMQMTGGDISDETKEKLAAAGYDPEDYEDYYTRQQQYEKSLANLLTPVSERLFSGAGSVKTLMDAVPAAKKWLSRQPSGVQYLTNVAGEALEEVPGNIFEEGTDSGFSRSWYADELTDENGEYLKDEYGNPLKGQYTDIDTVLQNFNDDVPDALAGGAAVGSALGLLNFPRYLGNRRAAKQEATTSYDPEYDSWKEAYESKYGSIEE